MGIEFGPVFRSVQSLWTGDGEAIGEISLAESLRGESVEAHPVVLDRCFQVMSAARNDASDGGATTYLPFGWERKWLTGRLPDRVICHARMREQTHRDDGESDVATTPETFTGDLRICTLEGELIGGFEGYTVKKGHQSQSARKH